MLVGESDGVRLCLNVDDGECSKSGESDEASGEHDGLLMRERNSVSELQSSAAHEAAFIPFSGTTRWEGKTSPEA